MISVSTLAMASTAYAGEDDALCNLYSKSGGAMVEFMLPLTLQQFVDMTTGKDTALMNRMSASLLKEFEPAELIALSTVGEGKAGLIGEAAGHVAVELLMSGQATTKSGIVNIMSSNCHAIGPETIIANQLKSRAATSANMGKAPDCPGLF